MNDIKNLSAKRRFYNSLMKMLSVSAAFITGALVIFLLVYVFSKGLGSLTFEMITTKPSYLRNTMGILPNILDTFYLVIAALIFVLPLGVGAAIYLTEYATNRKLVSIIEFAAESLSGIPSIIYGLVGMLFFVNF